MATLTDNTMLYLGIIAFNYLLLMFPRNWTKNVIGGVLTIIIGFAGYVYMSTDLPWGILVMMIGLIYTVFKLGELGQE